MWGQNKTGNVFLEPPAEVSAAEPAVQAALVRYAAPMARPKSSEALLDFCRSLPGVTEDVKWDNDLVFSVGGKMFAVFALPGLETMSFKVEPTLFPVLTARPRIRPAPYLAKHSWIYLEARDALPREELEELLRESHALVAQKLSKKARASLGIAT